MKVHSQLRLGTEGLEGMKPQGRSHTNRGVCPLFLGMETTLAPMIFLMHLSKEGPNRFSPSKSPVHVDGEKTHLGHLKKCICQDRAAKEKREL